MAANNLWWQFGRFAEAVKGIDPAAERFEPALRREGPLRVYSLAGKNMTIAWCRDSRNSWMTELRDGIVPEIVTGIALEIPAGTSRIRIYDPWTNQWSEGKVGKRIALPDFRRSLVVRFDR